MQPNLSKAIFSAIDKYYQYLLLCIIVLAALNIYQQPDQVFTPLSCIWTPACGEREALPHTAYEGVALLRQHNIESASLSDSLLADTQIHQRIIEAAYPIRIRSRADYALIAPQDSPATGCVLLERGTMLSLYRCKPPVP